MPFTWLFCMCWQPVWIELFHTTIANNKQITTSQFVMIRYTFIAKPQLLSFKWHCVFGSQYALVLSHIFRCQFALWPAMLTNTFRIDLTKIVFSITSIYANSERVEWNHLILKEHKQKFTRSLQSLKIFQNKWIWLGY